MSSCIGRGPAMKSNSEGWPVLNCRICPTSEIVKWFGLQVKQHACTLSAGSRNHIASLIWSALSVFDLSPNMQGY